MPTLLFAAAAIARRIAAAPFSCDRDAMAVKANPCRLGLAIENDNQTNRLENEEDAHRTTPRRSRPDGMAF